MSDQFYRAFEDKFRGSRELIHSRLLAYLPFVLPLLTGNGPTDVVDLGCGRGEWLELMQAHGFRAYGVDLDESMLIGCREIGLNVHSGDALTHLKSLPDSSQAIVSAFHLVEHLPFESVATLVSEALRVLRPGGLLILETPNPENVVVGTNNFYLDPTHQKPIPHQLLSFLPEYAGFYRTKVVRLHESKESSQTTSPGLLQVLVGASPDYAVVAQKSAPATVLELFESPFNLSYGLTLDSLANAFDAAAKHQNSRSADQFQSLDRQLQSLVHQVDSLERNAFSALKRLEGTESALEQLSSILEQLQAKTSDFDSRVLALEKQIFDMQRWRIATDKKIKNWRTVTDNDLNEVVQRIVRIENLGPLERFKYQVARPVVSATLSAATQILRPFPNFRRHANAWLSHNLPQVHERMTRLRSAEDTPKEAPTDTEKVGPVVPPEQMPPTTVEVPFGLNKRGAPPKPSDLLDEPSLAALPRPIELEEYLQPQRNVSHLEALETVTTLGQMRRSAASVCFVITVNNDDSEQLTRSIQSVLRQTDPAWEIVLCGDESRGTLISNWLDIDWRIRRLVEGATSNEIQNLLGAAKIATTQFVGLMSQGDVVDDDLVKRISQQLAANAQCDLIYTDEACVAKAGSEGQPFFKPDWSPDHQHSVNLLGRFLAMRKSFLLNLNPISTGSAEADEYLLSLMVTSQARHIGHIEDVLYVREREIPVPPGGFFSPGALEPARLALQHHLNEQSAGVAVVAHEQLGSLQVKWPIPENTPVTLLILSAMQEREIPGRGNLVLATHFVESIIAKSTFKGYKIIVVDDGYVPDDLRKILSAHGHSSQTFTKDGDFSFAAKSNFATSLVKEGVALLLNDDLEVISPDWIGALVGHALRPEVGVVGGKLLFPDGSIQHAGISTGLNGSAGHAFMNTPSNVLEYGGYASVERNCGAVTGAVMAYRKDLFDQMGGFDEFFRVDYNDIDFCLRCVQAGYRVVLTPHALLYHFHNSSFKRKHDMSTEREEFLDRWQHVVNRDPYYGQHLRTLCSEQYQEDGLQHGT